MQIPWHGKLTQENFREVGQAMLGLIGHNKYSFTISRYPDYTPRILHSLTLTFNECTSPLTFDKIGFLFTDSCGVWGCSFTEDIDVVLMDDSISITNTANDIPQYWSIYISK